MTAALLVIDVQTAITSGEWAAFDIADVIERINGVIAKARVAQVPVVAIQHEESEGPMQFEAEGWQLDPRLAVRADDPHVRKSVSDSFHRTELDALLKAHGVDRLVVCGLQSEYCVDSTVRGGLAHGYPVTLLSDAHSTLDNGVITAAQITAHHNATLSGLGGYGARVTLTPAAELNFDAP